MGWKLDFFLRILTVEYVQRQDGGLQSATAQTRWAAPIPINQSLPYRRAFKQPIPVYETHPKIMLNSIRNLFCVV